MADAGATDIMPRTVTSHSGYPRHEGADTTDAKDICPCCNISRRSNDVEYYTCNLPDLRSAVDLGCARCDFFLKCVDRAVPRLFRYEEIERIRFYSDATIKISLGNPHRSYNLDIITLSDKRSTALNFSKTRRILPGSTSSQATIETIKLWIEQCTTEHESCRSVTSGTTSEPFRPRRILDLRDDLVILREDVRPQRYACLSHCWGPVTNIVKTTTVTLAEFKVQIPWIRLTKTFQEAIDICRRLGIFYLWIDSLCIIQDRTTDWKEQAAKMGDIYENAFIVIAATKAQDGSSGCYSQTEPEFAGTAIPGYQDVYIRQELPKFPTSWHEKAETKSSCPLLHRAWFYQEMRLSSRVLHFCAQEVVWECRSKRRSESGHNDEDLDEWIYPTEIYDAVPYWKLAENPARLWYRTVQQYSGLNLTFASDKIAALAALTQRMERLRVDDQFLAGLWKKTLLLDLLWMVWPSPEQGRPDVVCAPLWSWPSVHSQVKWGTWNESTLSSIRIVDIHYVCVGSSHMGDFSEAKVTLRAPLIRAGKLLAEFFETRITCYQRERADGQTTGEVHTPEDDTPGPLDEIAVHDFMSDYRIDALYGPGSPTDSDVFIIPMGCAVWGSHAGLCVRRSQDHSTYERFGLARLKHRTLPQSDTAGDAKFWDRRKETGVLSTAILEGLPVVDITLV